MRIPRLACMAACVLSAAASAQFAPSPQDRGLPYHDVRLADGEPVGAVRAALQTARTAAAREARAAALERLGERVVGLRVQDDALFGTPHFVRSTFALLTEPRAAAPRAVVRDFVAEYADLFEIDAAELDAARTARELVTRHNGVTHLTYQQQIDGVDLWGAELKASVTRDGRLVNVSSTIVPRPEGGFEVLAPALDPAGAYLLAAADAGVTIEGPLVATSGPQGPAMRRTWAPVPELRADTELTSELLYFPLTRAEVRPAWRVVVPVPGIGHTYETMVDAVDGTILRRWDRLHFLGGTQDVTLNVFPVGTDSPQPGSPGTRTPTGFQFPQVPRTLVTVTGADVFPASPEGWIPDGANQTLGNNVDAHTDLDADNDPDLPRPQGSPFRVFDFPLDLGMAPFTYTDAAVTQLFYGCNVIHDALWEMGFDEPAANFQDDNFGRGGVGGDRLTADAQDGLGTNNANFSGSGSDGTDARIQMFVWDGPSPDIDGDFDSEIVYHEYVHGLSIRLSGGTVFGEQSGGMGEGWSDYFGIALNANPGDDPDAVYAMGAYATFQLVGTTNNYYWGIRRYPYTTDQGKSPLTYADIDPAQIEIPAGIPVNTLFSGNPADEVHNVGEIWCQVLLDARAALWNGGLGFSSNDVLMQLVVDGLKLQPSNPNMLEARDAILQADIVNNGGANLGELWQAFAARGMGGSATSPSGDTTTGIVEAFDVPILIGFDYPQGVPSQLAPMVPTTFDVEITQLGGDVPVPGSGTLTYSLNGGGEVTIPMNEVAPNAYEATLPAFACKDVVEFFVTIDTTSGPVSDPPGGGTFSAEVFTGTTDVLVDDFEQPGGWTVGAFDDDATTGIWERGDPIGTAAQPEDDNTEGGTDCFFTGQGSLGGALGENDVDGGKTTLFSPAFSLDPGEDARVSYARWYSNTTGADPAADVFEVEISNDGGATWVDAETVGPGGPDNAGGWIFAQWKVGDFVTPTANMQVRFIASDEAGGSLVEAAVDDFAVQVFECDVSCQTDLGFGGPGTLALSLCGEGLASGQTSDLSLTGALPNAAVTFFLGLANDPTPFKGGTLVPLPVLVSVTVQADGAGEFSAPVPGGGGPVTFFIQAVSPDGALPGGFAISNALQVDVLP